jgi:hypothetical protein
MRSAPLEVTGPAEPQVAWDRYLEPARWSSWSPQIRSVTSSDDRLVTGTSGQVRGPLGLAVPFVVDAVDEAARTWSWTVRPGPLVLRLHHGVRPAAAGGSLTWLVVEGPAPVVLGYLPLAGLALRRLVR